MRYTRQYDTFRCGPTVVANVVKWAGAQYSYRKNKDKLTKLLKCSSSGTKHKNLTKVLRYYAKTNNFTVKYKHRPLLKEIESHLKQNGSIVISYQYDEDTEQHKHLFFVDKGYYTPGGFVFSTVNWYLGQTHVAYNKDYFKKNVLSKYRDCLSTWFIKRKQTHDRSRP
jgi:hypothetical protein